jgi:hypothetical protein
MLTPVELHAEPTVMSWVAIELDGSGDADCGGTENSGGRPADVLADLTFELLR